jgi:DNA repair protein RadD
MTRIAGFSGTVFRLQGGSLVEGEGAPFDKVVYTYSIMDGIRDGYLVPAYSVTADDKMDPSKLRKRQGEYDTASQDAQMLALMDNHVAQMIHHGAQRRAWLVFEASTKSAKAMVERLQQWGVAAGLVLGETPAGERAASIAAFRAGRLRCLVNVAALTTGFDVQEVDMLVMRRATMSLGLYIQMCGRLLRTIGGSIDASVRAGKADGIVLDFAGNIDQHGALDWLRPKDVKSRLVSCESCGKRNGGAAARCWSCDEPMTKLCPGCLASIRKGLLDCPECGHDMRTGGGEAAPRGTKLLETPSGAALISAWAKGSAREGGWVPVRKAWEQDGRTMLADNDGTAWELPAGLVRRAPDARWVRGVGTIAEAVLVPNGAARNTVMQVMPDGREFVIPMPPVLVG